MASKLKDCALLPPLTKRLVVLPSASKLYEIGEFEITLLLTCARRPPPPTLAVVLPVADGFTVMALVADTVTKLPAALARILAVCNVESLLIAAARCVATREVLPASPDAM